VLFLSLSDFFAPKTEPPEDTTQSKTAKLSKNDKSPRNQVNSISPKSTKPEPKPESKPESNAQKPNHRNVDRQKLTASQGSSLYSHKYNYPENEY